MALFRQTRRIKGEEALDVPRDEPVSASKKPETHARHKLEGGPPYSVDSALHVSRYAWAIEHHVRPGDTVVDLGCGTGFGVEMLADSCQRVIGLDLDPNVTDLNQTTSFENATFVCGDACLPGLASRLDVHDASVALSMETIEHLEDYYSYIENAIGLLGSTGTFIVGTPNRTMTYERYPERRHMDPSHVQEFTATSLGHTLREYFESVDLFFQSVPGFWTPTPESERREAEGYELADIAFDRVEGAPALAFDAFALVAVCTSPIG